MDQEKLDVMAETLEQLYQIAAEYRKRERDLQDELEKQKKQYDYWLERRKQDIQKLEVSNSILKSDNEEYKLKITRLKEQVADKDERVQELEQKLKEGQSAELVSLQRTVQRLEAKLDSREQGMGFRESSGYPYSSSGYGSDSFSSKDSKMFDD